MKRQIRHNVFETNSSTQHTLTIKNAFFRNKLDVIPANTTFEFSNYIIEDIEGDRDENDLFNFRTEQERLALCIAFCMNAYENLRAKETHEWYWDYHDEAEENDSTINDTIKDRPYFVDLYAAIKEVRNTDLVIVDGIYRLDSLNDDMAFDPLFKQFENAESSNDLKEFFKYILFENVYIEDEMLGM